MPHSLRIKAVASNDTKRLAQGLDLVRNVFHEHMAPHLCPEGVTRFLPHTQLESFLQRQEQGHLAFVAELDGSLAGFMELRPLCHVAMRFVANGQQRRGIGRHLLRKAVTHCSGKGGDGSP